MKLGSLFDGSGGFPLAGALCGVEPAWASEVEPYPIAVTRTRIPMMKHLGDISKINGGEIEPVDIITFGSPCQDLSVAGKRAGLKHEANGDDETTRSGLFMEAVRIIKEMRSATNGEYPRFALWENVPGAFSSNNGRDFRVVLEELIRIVEPDAVMPNVPKAGWAYADSFVGDGWGLAWRVFDAQYWGVPQRRRRIHLVVDFRGECAREILFEREGLRGYFAQGRTPWEGAAEDAQGRPGADDSTGEGFDGYNGDLTGDVSSTLGVNCGVSTGRNGVIERDGGRGLDAVGFDAYNQAATGDKAMALRAARGDNEHLPCVVYDARGNGDGTTTSTVTGDHERRVTDYSSVVVEPAIPIHDQATRFAGKRGENADGKGNGLGVGAPGDPSNTLTAGDRHAVAYSINHQGGNVEQVIEDKTGTLTAAMNTSGNNKLSVVYALDRASFNQGQNAQYAFEISDKGVTSPLVAKGPSAVSYSFYPQMKAESTCFTEEVANCIVNGTNPGYRNGVVTPADPPRYIVRRLTPTECARLQGFPDRWGDIEQKDSLTDEEYRFWLDVVLTCALINGTARPNDKGGYDIWREVKPDKKKGEDFEPYWENTGKPYKHKARKALLTWYNKLQTDSAEYKMWGNGIALPPALYCMQGMVEVLERLAEDEDWML